MKGFIGVTKLYFILLTGVAFEDAHKHLAPVHTLFRSLLADKGENQAYFSCVDRYPEAILERYNYPHIPGKYQLIRSENPGREPGEITIDEGDEARMVFFNRLTCSMFVSLHFPFTV